MADKQFQQFLSELQTYLKQPKIFVTNIERAMEFYNAVHLAQTLFHGDNVEVREDPLQTGAMILHVEMSDMIIRGQREIKAFSEMIELADNFEIYHVGKGNICFAAVFQKVHNRI